MNHRRTLPQRVIPAVLALTIGIAQCPLVLAETVANGPVNSTINGQEVNGGYYYNTAGNKTTFVNTGAGGLWVKAGSLVRGLETNNMANPTAGLTNNGGTLHFSAPGSVIRIDGTVDVSGILKNGVYQGKGGSAYFDSAYLYQNGNIFANGTSGGLVQMNVGSLTMSPTARIEAMGQSGAGGQVIINATGAVDIQSEQIGVGGVTIANQKVAIVDVSGNIIGSYNPALINIEGGLVNLEGVLRANGSIVDAGGIDVGSNGGTVRLVAHGQTPAGCLDCAVESVSNNIGGSENLFDQDVANRIDTKAEILARNTALVAAYDGDINITSSGKISANGAQYDTGVLIGRGPAVSGGARAGDGGMIMLAAASDVNNAGLVEANGANGINANSPVNGGNGGSVVVLAGGNVNNSGVIQANGGAGGTNTNDVTGNNLDNGGAVKVGDGSETVTETKTTTETTNETKTETTETTTTTVTAVTTTVPDTVVIIDGFNFNGTAYTDFGNASINSSGTTARVYTFTDTSLDATYNIPGYGDVTFDSPTITVRVSNVGSLDATLEIFEGPTTGGTLLFTGTYDPTLGQNASTTISDTFSFQAQLKDTSGNALLDGNGDPVYLTLSRDFDLGLTREGNSPNFKSADINFLTSGSGAGSTYTIPGYTSTATTTVGPNTTTATSGPNTTSTTSAPIISGPNLISNTDLSHTENATNVDLSGQAAYAGATAGNGGLIAFGYGNSMTNTGRVSANGGNGGNGANATAIDTDIVVEADFLASKIVAAYAEANATAGDGGNGGTGGLIAFSGPANPTNTGTVEANGGNGGIGGNATATATAQAYAAANTSNTTSTTTSILTGGSGPTTVLTSSTGPVTNVNDDGGSPVRTVVTTTTETDVSTTTQTEVYTNTKTDVTTAATYNTTSATEVANATNGASGSNGGAGLIVVQDTAAAAPANFQTMSGGTNTQNFTTTQNNELLGNGRNAILLSQGGAQTTLSARVADATPRILNSGTTDHLVIFNGSGTDLTLDQPAMLNPAGIETLTVLSNANLTNNANWNVGTGSSEGGHVSLITSGNIQNDLTGRLRTTGTLSGGTINLTSGGDIINEGRITTGNNDYHGGAINLKAAGDITNGTLSGLLDALSTGSYTSGLINANGRFIGGTVGLYGNNIVNLGSISANATTPNPSLSTGGTITSKAQTNNLNLGLYQANSRDNGGYIHLHGGDSTVNLDLMTALYNFFAAGSTGSLPFATGVLGQIEANGTNGLGGRVLLTAGGDPAAQGFPMLTALLGPVPGFSITGLTPPLTYLNTNMNLSLGGSVLNWGGVDTLGGAQNGKIYLAGNGQVGLAPWSRLNNVEINYYDIMGSADPNAAFQLTWNNVNSNGGSVNLLSGNILDGNGINRTAAYIAACLAAPNNLVLGPAFALPAVAGPGGPGPGPGGPVLPGTTAGPVVTNTNPNLLGLFQEQRPIIDDTVNEQMSPLMIAYGQPGMFMSRQFASVTQEILTLALREYDRLLSIGRPARLAQQETKTFLASVGVDMEVALALLEQIEEGQLSASKLITDLLNQIANTPAE